MKRLAVACSTLLEICREHGLLATASLLGCASTPFILWPHDEDGQGFAEYALIFALIVLVAAVALSPFGGGLASAMSNTFTSVIAML